MEIISSKFEDDIDDIVANLEKKEKELNFIMMENRRLVRLCASAINDIHNKKYDSARKKIVQIKTDLDKLNKKDHKKQVSHIEQEYTEARVLLSIIEHEKIPSHKELDVNYIAYLNGILDCIGELRREMTISLINGKEGDYFFNIMEKLYGILSNIHFSRSLLPGYKHKLDIANRQIEQARSELFLAKTKMR